MRQQLLAKQQELLRLQQQRLELELAEARSRLQQQARQMSINAQVRITTDIRVVHVHSLFGHFLRGQVKYVEWPMS